MSAADKKLLQTFERTNGGITGHAVSIRKDGIEIILVAADLRQVAHAAQIAGLGEIDLNRVQYVAVHPIHAIASTSGEFEPKGYNHAQH